MDWIATAILCGLCILAAATLASYLRLPSGLIRVCDFPRAQIAILAALLGISSVWLIGPQSPVPLTLVWALAAVIIGIQAWHVAPYTPLWIKESKTARNHTGDATLKVLVSNVLQTNSNYAAVRKIIREKAPDIVVLMEVDDSWIDGVSGVTQSYPHKLEVSLDNLYGMALYSRLDLIDPRAMYLLRDDIPSIMTGVRLPNGRLIRFFAIHPEPPLPHTSTQERDAEIIIAGQMALADPLPAVLTGDLNDVAWSRTTRRFRRLSGFHDPRVGRGMYNTFNAKWPIFRWPLDHLFHDSNFTLVDMACLEKVGSDHFPIYFELALSPVSQVEDDTQGPLSHDLDEAHELLDQTDHPTSETLEPAKVKMRGRS